MQSSKRLYKINKRIFDVCLSLMLLPVTLIFCIIISICSFILLKTPILFFQYRVGYKGNKLQVVKFRTMVPGKIHSRGYLEKDRIPAYGKFLRDFHLDELPQLLLIFTGKMTFVGPRPLLPEHLNDFNSSNVSLRQSVLPGLMCFSQNKLYKERFLDIKEQLELDLLYVKKASLFIDLKIIVTTITLHIKRLFKN